MRADRLLSILLLLQVHRRMTARELATRLEVSERTVHRDMLALSGVGVPVTAQRGSGGGWGLLEAYQTNLTGLNEAEIQALFLAGPPRLLKDLGLNRASEAALIKLLAALPAISRRDAQNMQERIHFDTAGWRQSAESVPWLHVVQAAVWQERKLQFVYPQGDKMVDRVVDPLGLVAKGNAWYLVAAVDGDPRTYRISRIRDARLLEDSGLRLDAFDLATYWEQSTSEFQANLPRYTATLRFAAEERDALGSLNVFTRVEQEMPADEAGRVTRVMQFETERAASAFVLGFAGKVEVIEPPALRERVVLNAEQLLALFRPR
jgi:predicted DNA-binding transcriptional regulator YafY